MNWLDITLIVFLIISLAVGARLGSVWVGACILGGFAGSFLADYYALPLTTIMGGFKGAHLLAIVALYLVGVLVVLIPGFLLSKVTSIIFLGLVDSAFGLLTGAFAGFLALSLALLLVVPAFPSIEKTSVWKKSKLVNPLQNKLEDTFNSHRFRRHSFTAEMKQEATETLQPMTKEVNKIKEITRDAIDKFKK